MFLHRYRLFIAYHASLENKQHLKARANVMFVCLEDINLVTNQQNVSCVHRDMHQRRLVPLA